MNFYVPNAFIKTFSSFTEKFYLDFEYDCFEFTYFSNVEIFKNWHLSNMYNLLIHKNDTYLVLFRFLHVSFHYCLVALSKKKLNFLLGLFLGSLYFRLPF